MNDVFLLLGSNLGDRQAYLQQAIKHIDREIAPVITRSSVYETQSWGKTDEPDYLNQVIQLKTDIPAKEILHKILNIEKMMGRKREIKWGSRIIDIDILFYNDLVLDTPGLVIPHPFLQERRFTLIPLAEIAPAYVHPKLHKTVTELLEDCPDTLPVNKVV